MDSQPGAARLHVLAEICDVTLRKPRPCLPADRSEAARRENMRTQPPKHTHAVGPSHRPPFGSTSQPVVELAARTKASDHLSSPNPSPPSTPLTPTHPHSQQHCNWLTDLLRGKTTFWPLDQVALHNTSLCFPGAARGLDLLIQRGLFLIH